jgi:hypothetical protein
MKKYILLLLIVLQALILKGQTVYQLDPSFNPSWLTSGTVSHTIMLSNGELIVAGNFSINSGPVTAKIAKLGFNGELLFSVNFSTTSSNSITSIDVQSDGKILVAGSFLVSLGAPGNRLVRLNTNGTIDNTLNIGSGFNNSLTKVKFFGNQIYVAGFFTTYNGVNVRPLIKINLNGALANDFLFDPQFTSIVLRSVDDFDILDDGTLNVGYQVRIPRISPPDDFFAFLDSFLPNGTIKGDPRILSLKDGFIIRIKRDQNNFIRIFYADVFRNSFTGQLISITYRELGSSRAFNSGILDFVRFQNGNRILVGAFTSLSGISRNRIVEIQSNEQVSSLFSNQAGPNNSVSAINIQSNENLILAGGFTTYNGQDVKPIIRLVPQLIDAVPPTPALNPLPRIDSQCLVNFSDLTIPTATDNVDGTIQGTTDQSIFPITTQGSTIITWTYTDAAGNTTTQTQEILIADTLLPVITANGDQSLPTVEGTCSALFVASASATDNCTVGEPTGIRSDGLALTEPYPVGVTTITWTVSDAIGNAAAPVIQTITVNDIEAPVITSNGNQTVSAGAGLCTAVVTVSASATDNCAVGEPVGIRSDGLALTEPYPVGVTTITWTVSDANGNPAAPVIQTITVNDTETPVISTNGNQNVSADAGLCTAVVAVSATATDNCTVGEPLGIRSDGLALTEPYPVGVTTITWSVSDAKGNAAAPVLQTITVNDTEAPVITSNGNQTVSADAGLCTAVVAVSASATDNCAVGEPTGVRSDGLALTEPYPLGVTTITWTVSDANGNAAAPVIQTITVNDTEAPVISTNGNQTVSADAGLCTAVVTVSASATDNCTVGEPTGIRSDGLALTEPYPVGVTTITWTVSDANGNAAAPVLQTITVNDTEAPVITSSGNQTVSADAGLCSAVVTVSASATDNCTVGEPTGIRSDGLALTEPYPVGVTTITWTVSDANGNAAAPVIQTITVNDTEAPVISTNGNQTVSADAAVCSAVVVVSASATDNCVVGEPTGIRSDGLALTEPYPVGLTTITWTVSDANGNAAAPVIQTITVNDTEAPVITTNGNQTVSADAGACNAVVVVSASATDNCTVGEPTGIRSDGLALTEPYPVGVTTITWNVSDANGNAAAPVLQTITVNDTEAPVISTNGNQTVSADAGLCTAVVTVSASATDNCTVGEPTGIRSDGLALTEPYPVGVTTITWTVSDANGNAAAPVLQTITVNDTEAPVITSSGNQTVSADAGLCSAVVTVSASATDNCTVGEPTGIRSDGLALTEPYPVGVTTITWTVSDANGNAAAPVIQTITVNDTEAPVITSNGNQTVSAGAGLCTAVVAVSATATDNCTVGEPTGIRSDGLALTEPYPVGVTTITWSVTDANGNAAAPVLQTITVNDTEAPVITSSGNQSVSADAGLCTAVVTVSASATDNCAVGEPLGIRSDGLALTEPYPVGVTTITWTVSDANGNAAAPVIQTITVNDTEAPVITSSGNQTVSADAGLCTAVVAVSASATDNCGVGEPTGVRSDGLALTEPYPVGVTTITWNVSDANGNAAAPVIQTITVNDTEAPVITSNGNQTVSADAGLCTAVVSVSASATDNCVVGEPTGIRSDGLALTEPYPVGLTTITWTVSDANGNAAAPVIQTITVNDTEAPAITCPANISTNVVFGETGKVVNYDLPIASDNCGTPSLQLTAGFASGAVFPLGTTTVSYEATDAAGNKTSCSFTVTVTEDADAIDPVISDCPTDITVSNDAGDCSAAVNWTVPTATDNSGSVTLTGNFDPGAVFPVGTTLVTYTATDAAGNQVTCSFNVTVTDSEAPAITCPANINTNVVFGETGKVVNYDLPIASDNCGTPSLLLTAGLASGAVFPLGTTTVSYEATDAAGNKTSCSFTVTVTEDADAIDPVINNCPTDITVSNDAGDCSATVAWTAPTATDNSGSVTLTSNFDPGAVFPVGTTLVTYTATDAAGNMTTCSFNVTVTDSEAPAITCPANISTNVVFGETGKVVNYDLPVATDNCGTPSLQLTAGLASGAVFPLGTTTVSYEATDAAGNQTSCSFTVTVTEDADAIDPVINNCPTDITVSNDAGDCSAAVDWTVPTATDNSGSVTLTGNFDPGAVFPVGTTLVTYTATDAAGNQTTCSFNVTVDDDELPVIGSVSDISVSVPSGQTVTSVSVPEPSVSDNCSATVTGVRSDGKPLTDPYPVGETTITWSAVDASGNPAVDVLQKVTVSQASANQSVVRFVLVNAATDQDLFELTQGMQISQNLVQGIPLNIRAETNPALVGSVFMRLTGAVNASKTENVAPYALFGDNNGNYSGRTLPTGNYTMYSMPYTQTNRRGTAGDPLTVNFSIVPAVVPVTGIAVSPSTATIEVGNTVQLTATVSPSNATNKGVTWSSSNGSVASVNSSGLVTGNAVGQAIITATTADGGLTASATINVQAVPNLGIVSFTLINAGTDQDMFELSNGMVINQSLVQGLSLNIRANTNPSIVGSVLFTLSGPVNRTATENEAPYAIFGDRNGNYSGRTLPAGTYTLSARAYSNRNRGGTAGPIKTITFTINSPVVRLDGSQASDRDNNGTETEMNVAENGTQSVEIMTGALKVYPNPITDGRVTVQDSQFKSGKVRYMLYSIHGALVQEGTVEIGEGNTIKLDFSEKVTHAAMYILVLDNENYLGPKRVNLVFE